MLSFFHSKDCNSGKSSTDDREEDLKKKMELVKTQRFDVFLSYAEEDEEFAEEMRSRLINNLNLRVFIPSEGQNKD